MSEKWQIGIYLIHKENTTTKKVYEYLNNEEKTYKQKSKYLLSNLLKLNSKDKYKPQRLKSADIENFEIYLFYRKHSREKPQWKKLWKIEKI